MPAVHGKPLSLDLIAPNGRASMHEQTRAQVAVFGSSPNQEAFANQQGLQTLMKDWTTGTAFHFKKIRQMRRHPTVKLVRTLSIASMAGAKWSVSTTDKAPEGAKESISELLSLQTNIMSTALRGLFDFGWQPYEKVWAFDIPTGKIKLRKLKPLLQDQTEIVIDSTNGAFVGFKQFQQFLSIPNCLLINQDVEGTYHYGEGTMPSIEMAFNRWLVTDDSNVRYDKKISGAHWVIHYPPGTSLVSGEQVDNYDLAIRLLAALEGSGSFVVPSTVQSFVTDLNSASNDGAWKIELMGSPGAQGEFQARLAYLDALIVRAAEFPERSILEGQYGTKAEAETHADFAVARMDFRNKQIVDTVNWHLVNQMMRMNYGEEFEDTVHIEVAPIADDTKNMLKTVYSGVLSNPATSGNEFATLDIQAIRDQLKLPTRQRTDDDLDGDGKPDMLNNMLANLNQQEEPANGNRWRSRYSKPAANDNEARQVEENEEQA